MFVARSRRQADVPCEHIKETMRGKLIHDELHLIRLDAHFHERAVVKVATQIPLGKWIL